MSRSVNERSESGREFLIVGTAVRKEREPKIRLLRGTLEARRLVVMQKAETTLKADKHYDLCI